MMVPCRYRNQVHGQYAVDCDDPLVALLGRYTVRENLVCTEDLRDPKARFGTKDKFADWCEERGIRIKNIYSGFHICIPTFFLEQQILFAAEFQTRDDAMLFRLSWIN